MNHFNPQDVEEMIWTVYGALILCAAVLTLINL